MDYSISSSSSKTSSCWNSACFYDPQIFKHIIPKRWCPLVKIIIKINMLPFFPCNIREFSSGNSYLEFHFCCCSYFLCLLCFFLSFRTTNSLRQITMTSCFLKLPFISWDQRYGCTFLSWALSFKNYEMEGNWAMTVKEWGPVISHWSIQKDICISIPFKYFAHLLLWFYGKQQQKRGIWRSSIVFVSSKSDSSLLASTLKYFL